MPTDKSDPKKKRRSAVPSRPSEALEPSSLPPGLDSLGFGWDDDVPPSGGVDTMVESRSSHDLDISERTTTIPQIPMEKIVAASLAELRATEEHDPGGVATIDFGEPDTYPSALVDTPGGPSPFEPSARPRSPAQEPGPTEPAPARTTDPSASLEFGFVELSESGLDLEPQPLPTEFGSRAVPEHAPSLPTAVAAARLPSGGGPPVVASSDPTEQDNHRATMKDRYAVGDFTGALGLAEALLGRDPGDVEAQRYATSCRDVLSQMYLSRLGSLEQVVSVGLTPEELRWLTLDHRAGFMLSMIDGYSTIGELLDISGMPRLDALRILSQLLEQRVIRLQFP